MHCLWRVQTLERTVQAHGHTAACEICQWQCERRPCRSHARRHGADTLFFGAPRVVLSQTGFGRDM